MTFHCRIELFALRTWVKIERLVEREDSEVITMRARRRLWTIVSGARKIVRSLDGPTRDTVFRDLRCLGIDVPNQPVSEQTNWRVRIVDDEHETVRFGRRAGNGQRRVRVSAIAAEFRRNLAAFLKCRARDFHICASLRLWIFATTLAAEKNCQGDNCD